MIRKQLKIVGPLSEAGYNYLQRWVVLTFTQINVLWNGMKNLYFFE